MYRSILCLVSCALITCVLHGQISEGGIPFSSAIPGLKATATLPQITLNEPELQKLAAEVPDNSIPYRYGIYTDTLIDLRTTGRTDVLPNVGKIWRLRISNPDAKSIQVYFRKFVIPEKARLFLYDDRMKTIYGAFTRRNIQKDSTFIIAGLAGNHVIVEYFEPEHPAFEGKLIIGSIGQAYKDPLVSQADQAFININCPIGKDAQLAKHAVCNITFKSGRDWYACSGALVNNTKNDGKPYFLTANHCLSTQAEASTLITSFNYEVAGCNGDSLPSPTLSGSTLLSTGRPSDYTLLLLNEVPLPHYQPYYAGWNANDEPVADVTGIHVPGGERKKISRDYDSISSNIFQVSWDDNSRSPAGSHWIVGFDEGKTAGGSSGSPLFNSDNQIIGQLHGGSEEQSFYGKFSYSYNYKPSNLERMSYYLDPDSTGVKSVGGYAPADNIPDAFFTTRFNEVCHNTPIVFNDYSVFGPYKRSWSIEPSEFNFLSETTDTSANPVIEFLRDTIYTVTLDLIVDDAVSSSETLKIRSGSDISVSVKPIIESELCDCDFDRIRLTGNGADNYTWSILPGDEDKIALEFPEGDTVTVIRNPEFQSDSGYTIGVVVTGTQSTCDDTAEFTYNVLRPANDHIQNAILLTYGTSDYYSNICATVQEGEPIPPFTSCTSQDAWCNEYGTGENIVENSVWFKFVAGATGRVSISSDGMDNQIALYEATSYQDILAGDYVIVAANDDHSNRDPYPLIISASVNPGDTYWIQVDGSGGGMEGEFNITIEELKITAMNEPNAEKMAVYPQPASEYIILQHAGWTAGTRAELRIYTISGATVLSRNVQIDNGTLTVNVSDLDQGVYIAAVKTESGRYVARIVKSRMPE